MLFHAFAKNRVPNTVLRMPVSGGRKKRFIMCSRPSVFMREKRIHNPPNFMAIPIPCFLALAYVTIFFLILFVNDLLQLLPQCCCGRVLRPFLTLCKNKSDGSELPPEFAVTKSDLIDLKATNLHYDQFSTQLMSEFPNFSSEYM